MSVHPRAPYNSSLLFFAIALAFFVFFDFFAFFFADFFAFEDVAFPAFALGFPLPCLLFPGLLGRTANHNKRAVRG